MKKKFMVFLFSVIFLSCICTAGVISYYARRTMQTILNNYQDDVLAEVKSKVKVFDELLFLLEKDLTNFMAEKMRELEKEMVRDGKLAKNYDKAELKQLAQRFEVGEIYLIDRQGIIFNTTFEPDKNFDLFKTDPAFKRFLLSLFGTGKIGTQRAALSNNSGIINFYMYLSPENSDFIIELSFPLRQYISGRYSSGYYEFLFEDFLVNAAKSSPYIRMIDIYSKTAVSGWSLIHPGKKFDLPEPWIEKLDRGEKIVRETENETTLYMPLSLNQRHFDFMDNFYVQITYDFGILNDFVKHATLIGLASTVLIILIFFLFSSRLFHRYVIDRIMRVQDALKRMEKGDYDIPQVITGDDELSEIAENVARMKERIVIREQAISESEARYRTLFERVPLGLFRATCEGAFEDVNPALLEMLGYPDKESLGLLGATGLFKIIDEHRRFRLLIEKEKMVQGFVSRIETKDQKHLWGEITCRVVEDSRKGATYLEGSLNDISPRIKAQKALVESEKKYRNIVESLAEGYFEVDLSGNLTFVNESLSKISGYSRKELIGMNNRDYCTVENAKRLFEVFNQIYQTGNPAKVLDYEIIRKDGAILLLELSAYLMQDSKGQPVGFRGIVRDKSEKIQSQRQRKRLEKQLRQAQRLEAVGKLAGGIAHDFNNLLTIILGNLNMLSVYLDKNHPDYPKWRERISKIEQQLDGGSHLTQQLLNFAKGGKTKARPIDINKTISRTLRMFSRAGKAISINKHFERVPWAVEADPGQMEQMFINLFVNANHAMPDGGYLYIRTENHQVDRQLAETYKVTPGKYVMISIRDTGVGMDRETQNRIFEPFFTTKKKEIGTGLGLSSVYGIIQSHKGIITVSSREGAGSVFKIYLPATDKPPETETAPPVRFSKGTGTVLLVDDEDDIRDVCGEMLQEAGYRVLTAHGGQKALEIYQESRDKIDLVILDMVMPGMSGAKTFNALKSIDPKVKILLSSGYIKGSQDSLSIRSLSEGFIQKPFTLAQISAKIREILG